MTKDDNPQAGAPRAAAKKAEARAAALRANLMKRKQQSKTRAAAQTEDDTPNKKED